MDIVQNLEALKLNGSNTKCPPLCCQCLVYSRLNIICLECRQSHCPECTLLASLSDGLAPMTGTKDKSARATKFIALKRAEREKKLEEARRKITAESRSILTSATRDCRSMREILENKRYKDTTNSDIGYKKKYEIVEDLCRSHGVSKNATKRFVLLSVTNLFEFLETCLSDFEKTIKDALEFDTRSLDEKQIKEQQSRLISVAANFGQLGLVEKLDYTIDKEAIDTPFVPLTETVRKELMEHAPENIENRPNLDRFKFVTVRRTRKRETTEKEESKEIVGTIDSESRNSEIHPVQLESGQRNEMADEKAEDDDEKTRNEVTTIQNVDLIPNSSMNQRDEVHDEVENDNEDESEYESQDESTEEESDEKTANSRGRRYPTRKRKSIAPKVKRAPKVVDKRKLKPAMTRKEYNEKLLEKQEMCKDLLPDAIARSAQTCTQQNGGEACSCFRADKERHISKLKHLNNIMQMIDCSNVDEWTSTKIEEVFEPFTKFTKNWFVKLASKTEVVDSILATPCLAHAATENLQKIWIAVDKHPRGALEILQSGRTINHKKELLEKLAKLDKDPQRTLEKKGVSPIIAEEINSFSKDRELLKGFANWFKDGKRMNTKYSTLLAMWKKYSKSK